MVFSSITFLDLYVKIICIIYPRVCTYTHMCMLPTNIGGGKGPEPPGHLLNFKVLHIYVGIQFLLSLIF